jgi:hypothetical protein
VRERERERVGVSERVRFYGGGTKLVTITRVLVKALTNSFEILMARELIPEKGERECVCDKMCVCVRERG